MGEGCEIYDWKERNIYRIWLAKTIGTDHFEFLGLAGIVVLKWVLRL
jgi:hypothetical protein